MTDLTENDLKLTIAERFAHVAAQSPQQVAVQNTDNLLTYHQLQHQAQLTCNFLATQLGSEQMPVPILNSNQKNIVPYLLGIVNAGHMFSAISSNDPVTRISSVLQDLNAPFLLVSDPKLLPLAKETCPPKTKIILAEEAQHQHFVPVKIKLTADSYAVITYTSGSTGEPKGVLRTHKMILHQSWTYRDQFSMNATSRMLGIRPYSASSSLSELFIPLLNGATIIPFDLKADGLGKLAQILKTQKVNMMRPPIQVLRSFLDTLQAGESFPDIRYVFATGDVFYRVDVERLRKVIPVEAIIVHQYAMSEAGILAVNQIHHDTLLDSEVAPAGRPVKGKELIILDEDGHALPAGEVGEICVRTKIALPGYWGKQHEKSNRFIPDPKDQTQNMFLTGDLGRLRSDGQLEHTGRKDWRVKILGYSVDLLAIEHTLMLSSDIQRAVVVALNDPEDQKRLVAYVLPSLNKQPDSNKLLSLVTAHLPSYMVPALIVFVAEFPLGNGGKVDRGALPMPNWDARTLSTEYEAPTNPLENKLVEIWKKILKIKQLGVGDNFFDLGGDSLMALEMSLEVERALSKNVPQIFFKNPTISSLAALLEKENHTESDREKFVLESQLKKTDIPKSKKIKKSPASRFKKLITRKYSLNDADGIVDFLTARYIVSKPYLKAKAWTSRWSLHPFTQNFIYRRRLTLLSKLVSDLKGEAVTLPSEIFQKSIVTNLSYGLSRYYDKTKRYSLGKRAAFRSSKFEYWQELADLLEHTPEDQLDKLFPINGLEYFMNAYQEGKGVILLTAHSISSPIRLHALSRKINLEIPTISYRIPIRQSQYHQSPKDLPNATGLTMNAEIALFGQKLLQQGQVINIVGDTSDPYGVSHQISLAGRGYRIKSGFAELALNTGARIIPHFGGCLADGTPELNFLPPLEPGKDNRSKQVENLIHQYALFINQVWENHPEVLHWKRIKGHFSRSVLPK